MIGSSGHYAIESRGGRPRPTFRVEVGPYEGDNGSGYPSLARDLGGYDNAELTDRIIGVGAVSHRIPLLLDSAETANVVVELDNRDNGLSQLLRGATRFGLSRGWFRDNRPQGRLLRIQGGIEDRDGARHFLPLFEGTIEYVEQQGGRAVLRALGLMKLLSTITVSGNPTWTAKTPAEIIEDLWHDHTSEANDYGRPFIDRWSFDNIGPASPFLLDVTGAGSSTLQNLSVAEAMVTVARHGFAGVFVDGARLLRYVQREYTATYPDFTLAWDRNLIEGRTQLDESQIYNKVTVKWGASLTSAGPYEHTESQARYGVRSTSWDLPLLTSATDASQWGQRFLAEFAFPVLTYEATADLSALVLEPGDWVEVYQPEHGLAGDRFQVFERSYDPGSHQVRLRCHNPDLAGNESEIWIWGVSRIDGEDEFK